MGPAGEAVKGLLLKSKGETKWIGCCHTARSVVNIAPQRLHVRDQDAIGYVVIGMKSLPLRPHACRAEAPAFIGTIFNATPWPQRLRDRERTPFHAPRAQVLGNNRGLH